MKKHIVIIVFLLLNIAMYAQERVLQPFNTEPEAIEQDSIPPSLIVEQADNQILDATTQDTVLYFNGNVRLFHEDTYMYCDTAKVISNNLNAYGDVSIVKNDSIKVFADSLYYNEELQKAYLYTDVVLEDEENQLFTKALVYNINKNYAIYTDTALLVTKNYEIKSKRGIYYTETGYADFTNSVSVEGKNTLILTDSMRYYNKEEKLDFKSPVIIEQNDKRMYSKGGFYNLSSGEALFEGDAQLATKEETITAHKIEYNTKTENAYFTGNAKIKRKEETGTADIISYNKEKDLLTLDKNAKIIKGNDVGTADIITISNKNITLNGNATYVTPDQTIKGETIIYNTETDAVKVNNNGYLSFPPLMIWSGDIDYDKSTDIVKLKENVIVRDTSNDYTLHGDFVNYYKTSEDVIAFNKKGKPWIESISEKDTLYMSGDTLRYTTTPRQNLDTLRVFRAYPNVEFLSKDITGIADTLNYNRTDGIMLLRKNAMMWKDSTQLQAEEIDVTITDNNPSYIKMHNEAIIMNTSDMKFFNQMRGDNAQVFIKDQNIDRIKIDGNVETLYYIQEKDKSYIGVDKSKASKLNITFEKKEIKFINYYKDINSEIHPIKNTNHQELSLKGAIWQFATKPKEFNDLLD